MILQGLPVTVSVSVSIRCRYDEVTGAREETTLTFKDFDELMVRIDNLVQRTHRQATDHLLIIRDQAKEESNEIDAT